MEHYLHPGLRLDKIGKDDRGHSDSGHRIIGYLKGIYSEFHQLSRLIYERDIVETGRGIHLNGYKKLVSEFLLQHVAKFGLRRWRRERLYCSDRNLRALPPRFLAGHYL